MIVWPTTEAVTIFALVLDIFVGRAISPDTADFCSKGNALVICPGLYAQGHCHHHFMMGGFKVKEFKE